MNEVQEAANVIRKEKGAVSAGTDRITLCRVDPASEDERNKDGCSC